MNRKVLYIITPQVAKEEKTTLGKIGQYLKPYGVVATRTNFFDKDLYYFWSVIELCKKIQ